MDPFRPGDIDATSKPFDQVPFLTLYDHGGSDLAVEPRAQSGRAVGWEAYGGAMPMGSAWG